MKGERERESERGRESERERGEMFWVPVEAQRLFSRERTGVGRARGGGTVHHEHMHISVDQSHSQKTQFHHNRVP